MKCLYLFSAILFLTIAVAPCAVSCPTCDTQADNYVVPRVFGPFEMSTGCNEASYDVVMTAWHEEHVLLPTLDPGTCDCDAVDYVLAVPEQWSVPPDCCAQFRGCLLGVVFKATISHEYEDGSKCYGNWGIASGPFITNYQVWIVDKKDCMC